jgi:cell division protein FtsW
MRKLFGTVLKGDVAIWVLTFVMLGVSVLTVYSFVPILVKMQGGSELSYLLKHVFYIVLAIGVMIWAHRRDTILLRRYARFIFYAACGLMLFTMFFGQRVNEAGRWVSIPFVGLTFQPSDFAKIALVILISHNLTKFESSIKEWKVASRVLLAPIVVLFLLIFKDNFSTAAIVFMLAMTLLFVGMVPIKHIIKLFVIGIAAFMLAVAVQKTFPAVKVLPRLETWINRISNKYADASQVDLAGNLQQKNAEQAIHLGGVFGQGAGKGKVKEFIPEAYADFYYASFVEEFGLLFAIVLTLSYLVFLFRIFRIGLSADDTFDTYLCIGIGLIILSQATVNILVCVGIFPVTGQNMPLLAMGGSAMIATCLSLGIVQSIARKKDKSKSSFDTNKVV